MASGYIPPKKDINDLLILGTKPIIEVKTGTLRGTTVELKLNNYALTSLEGIEKIPRIKTVNSLNLSVNNFNDFDIRYLDHLPNLQHVAFYMNPMEADVEKMEKLKKDFARYKHGAVFLNTSVRYRLSDEELEKFKVNLFDKFGVYLGPDWR
jgi:hypothetical protein